MSFALPFAAAGLFAYFVAGWDLRQSEIAGIALSTTSLAVVYAVLVETGLTNSEIGKVIMAATFVTDLGTATALSVLFIQPTPFLALFIAVSVVVIVAMLVLQPWFFRRYGDRVIEPETKGAFVALFFLMWTADLAKESGGPAGVPAGSGGRPCLPDAPRAAEALRVVAFSLLTPFFFLNGGMNVSLGALAGALPLLAAFFVVKLAAKSSAFIRRPCAGSARTRPTRRSS